MKHAAICVCMCICLLSGCASPSRDMPTTRKETIRRMKQVRVPELNLRQSEIMTTLRDFEALARYAKRPFRLSAHPVREQIARSHAEWLANRQPLPKPKPYGKGGTTEWEPAGPAYTAPITTCTARDLSLRDALTVICQVSALQWSIDRWNNVVVSFKTKAGQQLPPPRQK